jgi:hypothetical protein
MEDVRNGAVNEEEYKLTELSMVCHKTNDRPQMKRIVLIFADFSLFYLTDPDCVSQTVCPSVNL